ncbi:PRD domain-containing protein [Lactobacillus rizhaonensis]|uniref:PRD domain-containing protein n=1 Tax=Lactobacillus rizhaonensis TaxID=3082863 RepID=UPI0030C731D9
MKVELYKEFQKYIAKSNYKDELRQVMVYVVSLIHQNKLQPSDLETQILGNHLFEMVNRAKNEEKLEKVDKKIFAKVSQQSLEMSQQVVDFIDNNVGKIAESEKYVLSIHFENMKLD